MRQRRCHRRRHPGIPPAPPKGPLGPRGALRFPGAHAGGRASFKEAKRCANDDEMLGGNMSDEFDDLNATEKAGIGAALNRCRALTAQIARELRNKRSGHVDKLSLADLCASLEHAAKVLGQKGRQPVENTPAPVEKGSRARHR
jgi:hypothetical protein